MSEPTRRGGSDLNKAAQDALADIQQSARAAQDAQAKQAADQAARSRAAKILRWAVLVICLGVIVVQMPKVIDAIDAEEKPLRIGPADTDAVTDQCIRDLWRISKRLQDGKLPADAMRCPASGQPYQVVRTADDIIVRSPRPDLYGFKALRVSKRHPVPEVVQ